MEMTEAIDVLKESLAYIKPDKYPEEYQAATFALAALERIQQCALRHCLQSYIQIPESNQPEMPDTERLTS